MTSLWNVKVAFMITIQTTTADLAKMRFAYHPLMEVVLSYRVLTNPAFQAPHGRWLDEVYRTLQDTDLPFLRALVPPMGYIPDFLTFTPLTNRVNIEDDLAEILATPDDIIQSNVLELIKEEGDSEIRRFFVVHPREAVWCLVEEIRMYWQHTLAHYWQPMMTILESDVLYRARLLALNGADHLFADLHSTVSYERNQIQIQPCCQYLDRDVELDLAGNGLQLVPTIFRGCGRMFQVTPEWKPLLAYGVRGTGGIWNQKPPSQSLELALGTGRARILEALKSPASTGEIAHKVGVSSGAVSQVLSRLAKAGLVEAHRNGKRVYYHLTRRGEELIALFERIY
jgi:DNA-binding transcriptional ArsR family regulator